MSAWITSVEFGAVSGINRRVANRLCKLFFEGRKAYWHNSALEVQICHGRGGRSGLHYQVKVSSLPPHLQERLKALQTTNEVALKLRLGSEAQFERAWKREVIAAALDHPRRSPERKAEVEKLAGTSRLDWTGHTRKLTKSTLYKWIEIFELEGIHGLAQKVRSDKGQKKVFISRAWSNAVPFDDDTKATIERDLRRHVQRLIGGDSTLGWTLLLASEKLAEMTAAYGFRVAEENKQRIFTIPRTFVDAERAFKAVARHRKDRKASEDDRPRIRRTTADLQPMEIIVMDVHHINVNVARPDGTYSTPKLIAFHDIATNRVFSEIIHFENRGGVRNADVITAFVNMCQHPAFGVPQFLYADNGSEYRFADDLEDALKLGTKVVGFDGIEERSRIIRAKPYNAAAKQVEGLFRQLNQQYFRHIPGWIDDDRMNPKRPELGKLHAPYAKGFDAFCDYVYGLLTAYEHKPQRGALKGKSPYNVFGHHVQLGWKATVLEPSQLLTVFTRPDTRVVKKHGIDVNGATWTCDGLLEFFGRTVIVHIPKYHGFGELLVTDEYGAEIGIAVADREFHVLDERGAQESARRTRIRNKAITDLRQIAPPIDVGAEIVRYGRSQLPVVPNEPDGTISVSRPGSQRRAILPVEAERTSRMQQDEELRRQNRAASEIFAQMLRPTGNKP